MADNGQQHGAVVQVGEAALTGWGGAVGRAIAKPIAKRTRFVEEQIEAILGLVLLAYTIYRVGRPLIRVLRRSYATRGASALRLTGRSLQPYRSYTNHLEEPTDERAV